MVFLSSAQLDRASSDATAYYRPAPVETIEKGTLCPFSMVEQMSFPREIKDLVTNGYKSVFTNPWLVRQMHRSWIKGLGKNPQKEWTRSLFAVPFVRGHPNRDHRGLRENDDLYTLWHATRGVFTSLPAEAHTKSECVFYTLSARWHEK